MMNSILEFFKANQRIGIFIRRVIAFMVDWYFVAVLSNVGYMIVESIYRSVAENNWIEAYLRYLMPLMVVSVLYYVVVPCVVWNGQTVMQRAMQLKVSMVTGKKVNLRVLIKRFALCLVFESQFYSLSTALVTGIIITLPASNRAIVSQVVGTAMLLFSLASLVFSLLDKEKSMLFHDRLSRTYMVDMSKFPN
ncbi:MAG: RDD family protein [Anaerorhabdus sp.]